jgi:D-alanyl-lipoteichoic acid acyltransferase DltB (MBOAT superfamily)
VQFNSMTFAVFLLCVALCYHAARDRFRWITLLLGSVIFYAAFQQPHLLVVVVFIVVLNYLLGISLDRAVVLRRTLLVTGITGNLLPLLLLRYFLPVAQALGIPITSPWVMLFSRTTGMGVSIGVSFYSFQAISYLIDVYGEAVPAERNPGSLALYFLFFPKLLQGPIERADWLLPQLKNLHAFAYEDLRYGLVLFTLGAFKKVVVAERMAVFVNLVYGNVHAHSATSLILATVCYAFQLYADFSGYTDMALGIARLFGVRLTDNFRQPYFATSIADFWRRWHISLSQWLMHYLFMPLQIATFRWGKLSTPAALIITFAICGLWHGANVTFLVWGCLNGLYMVVSLLTKKQREQFVRLIGLDRVPRLYTVVRIVLTFSLVCAAWVWFRAGGFGEALYILTVIGQAFVHPASTFSAFWGRFPGHFMEMRFALAVLGLLIAATIEVAGYRGKKLEDLFGRPWAVRWAAYYGLLLSVILLGMWGSSSFLYFQF